MVQLGVDFDPQGHEPRKVLEALPAGWYAMIIVASEGKDVKDKPGSALIELTLEMDERYHPELKGRKVFDRLNLWNPNPDAVDIANRTLATIARSIGLGVFKDSEQLHHKPLAVKLKIRPAREGYDTSNEVSGYDALGARFTVEGKQPTAAATPGASAPASKAPAGKPAAPAAAPWARPS